MSNEEFARIKRFVERRSHDAAHVTISGQYCSPRSPSPKISFGACVCMEKSEEGGMDPEPDQLEPPSANTGFETPGQQCQPNWETVQTTAAGCLTGSVSSDLGGNTSLPTKRVIGTRAGSVTTTPDSSKPASQQTRRKPKDKETGNEENKQFDPGGKGGEPPHWKADVLVVFSFLGESGHGCLFSACILCFCLSVCCFCEMFLPGDHFPAS